MITPLLVPGSFVLLHGHSCGICVTSVALYCLSGCDLGLRIRFIHDWFGRVHWSLRSWKLISIGIPRYVAVRWVNSTSLLMSGLSWVYTSTFVCVLPCDVCQ